MLASLIMPGVPLARLETTKLYRVSFSPVVTGGNRFASIDGRDMSYECLRIGEPIATVLASENFSSVRFGD